MDLTRRELIATVAGLVAAPLASAKPKPLYSWKHVKGGLVAKEETRPPVIGPDWLWSDWNYRSHMHRLPVD
jgi:hypothetical protein